MRGGYRKSDVDALLAESFRAFCEEFGLIERADRLRVLNDIAAAVTSLKGKQ